MKTYLPIFCILLTTFSCGHLKQAYTAYQNEDYQKTRILCRQALQIDSTDCQAWALLGKAYLALDSLSRAEHTLVKGQQICPQNKKIQSGLISFYLKSGDRAMGKKHYKTAAAFYEKADGLRPENLQVLESLAHAEYKAGRLNRARIHFEKCMDLNSDPSTYINMLNNIEKSLSRAKANYTEGLKAYHAEKWQQAETAFYKTYKTDRAYEDVNYYYHYCRGRNLSQKRSAKILTDAIKALQVAVKANRAEAWFYLAEAHQKRNPNDFDPAIDAYQKVISLEPEGPYSAKAFSKLHKLRVRKKRYGGKRG